MVMNLTLVLMLVSMCIAHALPTAETIDNDRQTELNKFVQNHSFVFISGWPQSGTSFLHQVFTLNPLISSMVENCEKLLGKRCINWNHEGQWLIPGQARNILNSGVMCPHNGTISQPEAYSLLSEWRPYWAADKVYLVEKSPHSLLKIPLLRRVFAGALSLKFIVLMKHPVTLNVATPKGSGWQFIEKASSAVTNGAKEAKKKLSFAQTCDVMQFFLDLMRHDNSTIYSHRSPQCSMGWIPAMTALATQLADDPRSASDVRIVRFESFQSPMGVCRELFRFVFGDQDFHNRRHTHNGQQAAVDSDSVIEKLCGRYFGAAARGVGPITASTASSLPGGNIKGRLRESRLDLTKGLKPSVVPRLDVRAPPGVTVPVERPALLPGQMGRNGNFKSPRFVVQGTNPAKESRLLSTNESRAFGEEYAVHGGDGGEAHRALRLRSNQESADTFSFIPELVSERGRLRVREFAAAYQTLGPSLKAQVDALNKQLQPFGYSLFHWQMKDSKPSLFQKWEIGKAYQRD